MFNTVCIVGIGLLGGSLARDLKQHSLANEVVGVCRSPETANRALELGILDRVCELHEAVSGADLIVMATPMQAMLPLLEKVHSLIPPSAILTDVGSVKTDLYQALNTKLPQLLDQFVLAHPIAGGEASGVDASRLALFENKHVVVTETPEVDPSKISSVIELWQAVGARVKRMSLEQHDAVFAKTSHLPHVIAFSLVNYLSSQDDRQQLFDLAAAGFYDFTRIASSNAEMWRDICITNEAQVVHALNGFASQISAIKDLIESGDQAAILEYFGEAKHARDQGLLSKAEAMQAKPD